MQEAMTVLDPVTLLPVPPDGETIGEIMFRGNITMNGYLKNPSATEEAFVGGWLHIGDLAVIEQDGYVRIKDRSKDVIISGGENISSSRSRMSCTVIRQWMWQPWWRGRTRNGARCLALSSNFIRVAKSRRPRFAVLP